MSGDIKAVKRDAEDCLRRDRGVVALEQCIAGHFPDLEVFRENDDLVIRHGQRFLIVKRTGADSFRVTENVAVPSTNVVDSGGGRERSVHGLVDEIAAFAAS